MKAAEKVNIAMIGRGFMGKAHALAQAAMPMFFWPAPAIPVRKVMVDVTDELASEAQKRSATKKPVPNSLTRWWTVNSPPPISGTATSSTASPVPLSRLRRSKRGSRSIDERA
jgi:hypothetical protein